MKTRTLIIISTLLAALTSCGSAAQYASNASHQRYQDGVYYSSTDNILKPEAKEQNNQAVQVETTDTDPLVAKTKSSPIFMKSGEKVDTLFIPTDRTAKISLNGSNTTVTLYDNSWDTWHSYQPWYASSWYYGPMYSPYYWGYSPWYYNRWYYDPWYYRPWNYGFSWNWGWGRSWLCFQSTYA